MAFTVDYFPLDSTQVANHAVTLKSYPVDTTNVAMDLIGGTAQARTGDFGIIRTATDGTVVWGPGYALYGILDSTNDKIRVIYDSTTL